MRTLFFPMFGALFFADVTLAEQLNAQQIAEKVWTRPDGLFVIRQLSMELIDPNGNKQTREAEVHRGTWPGVKKTRISFVAPRRVKHTAFLIYDYQEANQIDEQWMYLPALRRERRIPATDRGDNFMGSEFSYEDIKSELKFPLQDYDFTLVNNDASVVILRGIPKTKALAKELGYGRFEAVIDQNSWLPEQIDFWDTRLQPLKQVLVEKREQVQGFWIATDLIVNNLQSGHRSRFYYKQVEYQDSLDDEQFSVLNLRK